MHECIAPAHDFGDSLWSFVQARVCPRVAVLAHLRTSSACLRQPDGTIHPDLESFRACIARHQRTILSLAARAPGEDFTVPEATTLSALRTPSASGRRLAPWSTLCSSIIEREDPQTISELFAIAVAHSETERLTGTAPEVSTVTAKADPITVLTQQVASLQHKMESGGNPGGRGRDSRARPHRPLELDAQEHVR